MTMNIDGQFLYKDHRDMPGAVLRDRAPVAISELQEQRDRLEKALAVLGDSLRELRERLDSVMRPPANESASDVGHGKVGQQGPGSAYGQFVAGTRAQVESLTDGVQDLLRRLAV
jgi:hypothetical protein